MPEAGSAGASPQPKPQQPAPAPPASAKAAGRGGPEGAPKQGAFKVIRNQPQEEGSSAGVMMAIAGVLVVLALGAALLLRRPASGEDQPGGGEATGPTTPATPPTPAPDFVLEAIEFLEGEGQLKQALDKTEEYLIEYPNAPELKAKRRSLRQRLGLEEGGAPAGQSAGNLLLEARKLAGEGKLDEALEAVDRALDADSENADALFLKGEVLARQGNKLDATGAFEAARGAGYDSKRVDDAIKRLR
jgi:tetratricopeptide (TPR) repeat protein